MLGTARPHFLVSGPWPHRPTRGRRGDSSLTAERHLNHHHGEHLGLRVDPEKSAISAGPEVIADRAGERVITGARTDGEPEPETLAHLRRGGQLFIADARDARGGQFW